MNVTESELIDWKAVVFESGREGELEVLNKMTNHGPKHFGLGFSVKYQNIQPHLTPTTRKYIQTCYLSIYRIYELKTERL